MAQRFGGPHSPGPKAGTPAPPLAGKRPRRHGARANLLFLAPFPFLFTAFFEDPPGLALDLGAFGAIVLAAWLTREGLAAEDAWEARKTARRPAIPRKIFGSVLIGLGLFLGALGPEGSLLNALIVGALGSGLHLGAFGLDPMRDKGMEGIDRFQQDRVARVADEAEKMLETMAETIRRTSDRGLADRVARFAATARTMIRQVEEDPRDLAAARRYLGVYLAGARDATVKFADLWARARDAQARADYLRLLDDLEGNFAARSQALLADDRTDLDIEIGVLRDRLAREGVTAFQNGDRT